MSRMPRPTGPVGLYDPTYEHDACGVAFVARLSGEPTHETVQRAIMALENLEHRGAAGADPNTGDGAGILLQMPDELMRGLIGQDLPPPGAYGVCVCFLPRDEERRAEFEALIEEKVRAEGQRVVGWRDIPVDKDYVGITANFYAPYIKQLVVAAEGDLAADQDAFERKLYVIRRWPSWPPGPDSSSRASPAAPSSTRACSPRPSCSATTPTCRTRGRSRRSRSSTRASPPTPSRAGSWRTRTG